MIKKIFRPVYVPIANVYHHLFKAPKRYKYLLKAIDETKAKVIVEVGTWNGDRALKMIERASLYNDVKQIHYIGFDLFESLSETMYEKEISKRPPTEAVVRRKLDASGAKVSLYVGDTHQSLPVALDELNIKFDFAFIDGGHSYDTIKNDWECISQMMGGDSVVLFDDYWRNRTDHGAKRVVDQIDKNIYNVEVLPQVDCFDNRDFGRLEISFAKVTRK